jgi:hypothetical protein
MSEIRTIPQVRRLAEERAEEISNGTLTLEQLGPTDREGCWLAAEDEAISIAERQMAQVNERADYFRRKNRGEDI